MTIFFDQKSGTPVALPILAPKRLIPQYNSFSNGAIPSVVNNKVHVTQLGSNALVSFFWGGGTATVSSSNVITFNMPAGLTIAVALTAGVTADHLGAADWFTNVSGGTHKPLKPQILSPTTVMFCDEYNGQNFIESAVGTGWLISGWIIVPIVEWAGMDTSSTGVSGGGSGGLAPRAITSAITAANNIMYAATVASSYAVTLPGGTYEATVGFLDPTGAYADTNYLDITPVAGQNIGPGAAGEALRLRKSWSQVVLYRVAGTTQWVMQAQATTSVAGGSVPGSANGVVTPTSIGESLSAFTGPTQTLTAGAAAQIQSLAITPGKWIVYGHTTLAASGGTLSNTTILALQLEVSTSTAAFLDNESSNFISDSTQNAQGCRIGSYPLEIITTSSITLYLNARMTLTAGGTPGLYVAGNRSIRAVRVG